MTPLPEHTANLVLALIMISAFPLSIIGIWIAEKRGK